MFWVLLYNYRIVSVSRRSSLAQIAESAWSTALEINLIYWRWVGPTEYLLDVVLHTSSWEARRQGLTSNENLSVCLWWVQTLVVKRYYLCVEWTKGCCRCLVIQSSNHYLCCSVRQTSDSQRTTPGLTAQLFASCTPFVTFFTVRSISSHRSDTERVEYVLERESY